jgi:hypothetical protein
MAQGFTQIQPSSILQGQGSPTVIPTYIGQLYLDQTTATMYIACGTLGTYSWGVFAQGSLSEFNKNTISGLVCWVDAANENSFTKDGSGIVSQWSDISGNGKHFTQTTTINKPIWTLNYKNTLPMVVFDGNNNYMISPVISQSQPFTLFVVGKFITMTASRYMVGCSNSDSITTDSTNTKWQCYFGLTGASLLALNTNYYVFTLAVNGTSTTQNLNTTSATISPGTNALNAALTLGSNSSGSACGNIALGELLLYSGSLSSIQKTTIQTYLNNKWGIY